MFKGVSYVVRENVNNLYRIYSIAKYELLADMRDSKLGIFWNFANPVIQVATYWFVFGFVFKRNEIDGVDFLSWLLGGMVIWFFISPCITNGCNAIYQKINIITKMKFPVSILPATVVLKEAFKPSVSDAHSGCPFLRLTDIIPHGTGSGSSIILYAVYYSAFLYH